MRVHKENTYKVTAEQLSNDILQSCNRVAHGLDEEIKMDWNRFKKLQEQCKVKDFEYDCTNLKTDDLHVILKGMYENDNIHLVKKNNNSKFIYKL